MASNHDPELAPSLPSTGDAVVLELLPLGKVLRLERGAALQDALFAQGVEFPCGGRGKCKGCRVKVLAGTLPATDADRQRLTAAELADGWRLACRARADGDLTIDLAQWEATILADDTVFAFTPQDGWGIAVDLGTTTVVAQLLDLRTGHVLAVRLGLNAQAQHGADIMSRIDFALAGQGQARLQQLIREQIGEMIDSLLAAAGPAPAGLKNIVIVGNTVMHHLFCGLNVEPLAHTPFETAQAGLQVFSADALGWTLPGQPAVRFLPCLGSFVGSDILGGILATRLGESDDLAGLVDLGTNGEIVIGNRERMLCASTAAGPAFEGARISMGMRAATGAICEVSANVSGFHCRVIGGGQARGICGSGLVDAVAVALDKGLIEPRGVLAHGGEDFEICPPVRVSQRDIRELQRAKGAIAAGMRILLSRLGAGLDDVFELYLAGAFGNYMNRGSAWRIGLLDLPPDKVRPSGNTALLGAKLALFGDKSQGDEIELIRSRTEHVPLASDPEFMDIFADSMLFPERR